MTLPDAALRVLNQDFGFTDLRPGQEAVIERLLEGRSALAVFPTGGGKSLCYQLPAVLLPGLTIVVSPLIALMKDQIDVLTRRGIAAARLDSSLTATEARQVWSDLRQGKLELLYIAPERFQNERFMARIRDVRVSMMAIDEAHCISEWGHNFRPDYLKLANVARELGAERVLGLTATATPAVAADICAAFEIQPGDHIGTGFHRPNLFLRMTPVSARQRDEILLQRFREQPPGATVVYVTLQRTAERVTKLLVEAGLPALCYHAGLDPDVRARVQDEFMGSADGIVVATIAFGMGIDKANIRRVIHYNLPKALENYAQEIGRAGRDGLPGTCELFATAEDSVTLENFSYGDTPTRAAVRSMVRELMSLGDRFDISRYTLSQKHDIRPLVVSTVLTYLELEGVLATTSPFYDTYKFKPKRPSARILADLHGEEQAFVRKLLGRSKKARIWFTIDLTESAEFLGVERSRCVAALDRLQEAGDMEIQVAGLRHGYRVVERPADVDALASTLADRFEHAETRDIERLRGVLALAAHPGCVVRELLSYFGEELGEDCGHCDRCAGDPVRTLPPRAVRSFGPQDEPPVRALMELDHRSLATPRQIARVLCGLPSPATRSIRPSIRRHAAWGAFGSVPFDQVLGFVEAQV